LKINGAKISYKILYRCQDIAHLPQVYFNLGHPVHTTTIQSLQSTTSYVQIASTSINT